MRYLILGLLVQFACVFTFAQTSVRGKVFDENSNPLSGAQIYVSNNSAYSFTDIDGNYMITGLEAGTHELVINYIGFEQKNIEVTLIEGETLIRDILLTEGIIMQEIVVNGRLEGEAKAMNTQKNRDNITNIIASEQIERFPDANIGDALKRVAGVNVQYDQGEARFANIRGISPALNAVTINGERIPSAEAEERFVQLDLIPADVIGTIELNKAVTPDMDGDAIGGAINLVTEKAVAMQQIKGTIGSGYSFLRGKPVFKGKLSYANRYFNNKLGVIASASILDKFVRSDNIEAEWDYTDENNKDASVVPTDFQVRQYYLERLRQSYSATVDYQLNKNNNIYLSAMYNWRNDWENRYRLRYKDIEQLDDGSYSAEIRRQTKGGANGKSSRLEDQRMRSITLGGEHFFKNTKVNWNVSSLKASEERPNERYISMRTKDAPVAINLDNLEEPSILAIENDAQDLSAAYGLKELTEEFKYTQEEDLNSRLDVSFPILQGTNASQLKIGVRYKQKQKERNNSFKEYAPIDEDAFVADAIANTEDITNDNYQAGEYAIGSFVKAEYLGDINLANGFEGEDVLEEFAGNFKSAEDVFATYAMYTQHLQKKWTFIGGVRYEATSVKSEGSIFDGDELATSKQHKADYSNIMPGAHIKYSPSNWTNIRLAWTNTLARPNYYDLVPFQEIDTEDNRIKVGNPNLEATTSTNFDFLVEHYFKNIGVVSGGVFYKDLTNVIAEKTRNDYTFQDNTYEVFRQPVNAGNADLYGFEVALQKRLDFLPGILTNLSLYANYTYTKSQLKNIKLEDRADEVLPLVGTPKNLVNLSLAYDTPKLDFRISYNFADAFIEEYNDEAFYDRWYDAVSYLDFNMDYELNQNWKVYFKVNNILNQPLRYYQGVEGRTMQAEYYGVHTKVGVKFEY